MPARLLVSICIKANRIGYYAARQHILKQGGTLHDVAFLLVTLLILQGTKS